MIPVDQNKFYVKDVSRGNCQQAAVASLLELPLEAVPNFIEAKEGFWQSFHNFIIDMGYSIRIVQLEHEHKISGYYLVYGMSPRGVRHAVVYKNGKLAHDPHYSRDGVVPEEINIIIPFGRIH